MSLMAKLSQNWTEDIDHVRDAIVDNVCTLISSRAPLWPTHHERSLDAITGFGMRNTTHTQSKANSDDIVSEIHTLIRLFEPRLSQVEIELLDTKVGSSQMCFRLSAVVYSALGEDSIVLDSFLDLSSNKLDVRKSNIV